MCEKNPTLQTAITFFMSCTIKNPSVLPAVPVQLQYLLIAKNAVVFLYSLVLYTILLCALLSTEPHLYDSSSKCFFYSILDGICFLSINWSPQNHKNAIFGTAVLFSRTDGSNTAIVCGFLGVNVFRNSLQKLIFGRTPLYGQRLFLPAIHQSYRYNSEEIFATFSTLFALFVINSITFTFFFPSLNGNLLGFC